MNSGTTAFNTTLNLTGHILLGLGIASALLTYMFLQALQGGGEDDSGYGGGGGGHHGKKFKVERAKEVWVL